MIKNISIVFIVFSLTACAQFDGSFLNSNEPRTEQLSDNVTPEVCLLYTSDAADE